AKGLAVRITGADSRVPKHGQRFTEKLNLGRREAALLCVLMLRGPQTVGELRGRTERLYAFEDIEGVESTLNHLAGQGMVMKLARQAGSREPRFAHLLAGEIETNEAPSAPAAARPPAHDHRLDALETGLAALRREFEDFRKRFE
ncbi:MAG TPA: DUF480 domain-containing protein, partial [Bryobacteraceae bacterium]|nr:DUF480 domain-containing protein [Bryobacteraceae bacterium]